MVVGDCTKIKLAKHTVTNVFVPLPDATNAPKPGKCPAMPFKIFQVVTIGVQSTFLYTRLWGDRSCLSYPLELHTEHYCMPEVLSFSAYVNNTLTVNSNTVSKRAGISPDL